MAYESTDRPRFGAALLALGLLAGPAAAGGAQATGDDPVQLAFIEVATERGSGYVGEALRVRLRFGFDAAFLDERVIQPFRRALDVPAQVEVEWLAGRGLPGNAHMLTAPEVEDGVRASVAVGDSIEAARQAGVHEREGRRFQAFELERAFVCSEPGQLRLDAPVLRFAFTTAFADDLVSGRTPVDRQDAEIAGAPLTVAIRPLPAGAPPGFTGAVGSYTVDVSATPRELEVGASLRLELVIARADDENDDDLFGFAAPELDELEGFHRRGHVESSRDQLRVIVYDLAPRTADVDRIPPIELHFFDPRRGAWETVRSAEIPLVVIAPEGGVSIGTSAPEGTPDESGAEGDGPPIGVIVGVVAGVLLLGLVVLARAIRGSHDPA